MGTGNVSMDSIFDAVQEMKRQQKTVWQRLNSLTLVENSKQTIRRLENLEEHVQNLETQCDNNSAKLTDINLLVHSLLEVVNKFVVAVENLQDNRTSEKTKNLFDTTDKRNNKNANHLTTTCVPVTKDSDETENCRNAKFDQPIYNMNSEHTIKPDICKTMCPYKTDLSIDVYNVSICNDIPRRTHKDDSKYISDAEEHRFKSDDNGQFACKEEDNVSNKDRSNHTTDTVQLSKNSMNCTKPNNRCIINKFGYKCKCCNIQNDNRMSFHSTSASFEGNNFPSPTFQVPVECLPVPNIKPIENFSLETKRRFMSLKSDSTEKTLKMNVN